MSVGSFEIAWFRDSRSGIQTDAKAIFRQSLRLRPGGKDLPESEVILEARGIGSFS